MSTRWDTRYDAEEYVYGTEPNSFLRSNSHRLTEGSRILCLAEGEGRNGVYLARQGHSVVAVDSSAVGLAKANMLAEKHDVSIETIVADLNEFAIEPAGFDAIISIFCHTPPTVREKLHGQVAKGLKPGGLLLLEAYTPDQLGRGTGGPPSRELMMTLAMVQEDFKSLETVSALELEREIIEGCLHTGMGAVVQLVAIKP